MRAHSKGTWAFLGLCGSIALAIGGCGGIVDAEAKKTFMQSLGNTSITVFPAFVRDGEQARYDNGAAAQIGEFLAGQKLATVTASQAEVPITGSWHSNQAKMLRESAADFSKYVRENATETDYALLAEYLIGGKGVPVGVHLYLLDAQGSCAYAILLNSHHKAFNDVDPKTVGDCTTMVINVMRDNFKPGGAAKAAAGPEASREIGPDSSLTIVPVVMAGDVSKDVADVVGLLLEKEGMGNITTVNADFRPPTDAALEQMSASFAEYVRENPIETDFALFAEIIGTRATGVAEVRAVLVDKAGSVIWTDRQTPEDADFQRIKPRNPMTCCVLLGERLRPQFRLTAATRARAGEGRMARLWAEKSGTPTKSERAAMDQRQQALKAALPGGKLLVFPVLLGPDVSSEQADHLVELLANEVKCEAIVAQTPLRLEIRPSSNEQRRLWDLARSFRAHLRENPPDADYALIAEYTIRPSDQKVWSVHFVVCDRAGKWVIVDFQNEYQPDFKSLKPQTREDCGGLVTQRLTSYLR